MREPRRENRRDHRSDGGRQLAPSNVLLDRRRQALCLAACVLDTRANVVWIGNRDDAEDATGVEVDCERECMSTRKATTGFPNKREGSMEVVGKHDVAGADGFGNADDVEFAND